MFDDLREGKRWKECFENLGRNVLKEWGCMWDKRLGEDISNKLFDGVVGKGEKGLRIDREFDVEVNEYKEEIKGEMEEGVEGVREGCLNIKGEFDGLIGRLEEFGESVEVGMGKMCCGCGEEGGLGGMGSGGGGFWIGE